MSRDCELRNANRTRDDSSFFSALKRPEIYWGHPSLLVVVDYRCAPFAPRLTKTPPQKTIALERISSLNTNTSESISDQPPLDAPALGREHRVEKGHALCVYPKIAVARAGLRLVRKAGAAGNEARTHTRGRKSWQWAVNNTS